MKKIIFLLALAFSVTQAHFVHAASFSLSPESGRYAVGDTITVHVDTNAEGVPINAVSGTIDFPANSLTLNSISKSGSLVNFWTVDPSADAGSVHFEGVILNPGYSGSKGLLLTLTFTVKAVGTAKLSFHSAAILANDGLGTNVLSTTRSATYTFVPKTLKEQPAQVVTDTLPAAPIVTSSTHPNQNGWYQDNTPLVAWPVPDDIIGVTLLIDQTPGSNPGVHSYGRITGYDIATLSDGVWYAHVRFLNATGWGSVAHYRLGVDTIAPTNLIVSQVENSKDASSALFNISAKDSGSGVDHYTFTVDNGSPVTVPAADSWQTKVLSTGEHTLLAEVFDKAGNSEKTKIQFKTSGINAPTIDTYPTKLKSGDVLTIAGHSYPGATLTLSIDAQLADSYFMGTPISHKSDGGMFLKEAVVDSNGEFTFTYDQKVKSGTYVIFATARLGKYQSLDSNVVSVPVKLSILKVIGQFVMRFFAYVRFIFLLVLAYFVYRYIMLKKKFRNDLKKIDEAIKTRLKGVPTENEDEAAKQKDMIFLEKLEVDVKNAELDAGEDEASRESSGE